MQTEGRMKPPSSTSLDGCFRSVIPAGCLLAGRRRGGGRFSAFRSGGNQRGERIHVLAGLFERMAPWPVNDQKGGSAWTTGTFFKCTYFGNPSRP